MLVNIETARTLIIERSRQLVEKLINKRGHDTPPFLPEEFARLQGIKNILQTNLRQTSAVLLRYADGYVIKVNKNHHPARQTFSIAHEIGHLLFSELKLERYINSIEYRTFNPQAKARTREKAIERLCDIAATELLMPEVVFKRHLEYFGISINSIEHLALIFKTSIKTTAFRIVEASDKPFVVLIWQPRLKNKPKVLRLTHCISPKEYILVKPISNIIENFSKPYKAYEYHNVIKSRKLFLINSYTKNLVMESKGFGSADNRYVLSIASLN